MLVDCVLWHPNLTLRSHTLLCLPLGGDTAFSDQAWVEATLSKANLHDLLHTLLTDHRLTLLVGVALAPGCLGF